MLMTGGGNSNIFYVHHYLGREDCHFLTNIVQMGWFNHQLGWDDKNPPSFLGHHQDDITYFFRFEDPKIFPPSLEMLASLGLGKPCMQYIGRLR